MDRITDERKRFSRKGAKGAKFQIRKLTTKIAKEREIIKERERLTTDGTDGTDGRMPENSSPQRGGTS